MGFLSCLNFGGQFPPTPAERSVEHYKSLPYAAQQAVNGFLNPDKQAMSKKKFWAPHKNYSASVENDENFLASGQTATDFVKTQFSQFQRTSRTRYDYPCLEYVNLEHPFDAPRYGLITKVTRDKEYGGKSFYEVRIACKVELAAKGEILTVLANSAGDKRSVEVTFVLTFRSAGWILTGGRGNKIVHVEVDHSSRDIAKGIKEFNADWKDFKARNEREEKLLNTPARIPNSGVYVAPPSTSSTLVPSPYVPPKPYDSRPAQNFNNYQNVWQHNAKIAARANYWRPQPTL